MKKDTNQKESFQYIYKVPLKKITKYGTSDVDSVIVMANETKLGPKDLNVSREVQSLKIPALRNFPIHSLDFSCYFNHPVQSAYYQENPKYHPCLYELQMVDGVTLFPPLDPMDSVIYAVDSNDLNPNHYATLADVMTFVDTLPQSNLQKEIDSWNRSNAVAIKK